MFQGGTEGEILQTSAGSYRLVRPVGGGEFGYVWLAFDEKNNQEVALKMLRREDWKEEQIARFKREFEILTQLKQVHLARVFDFGFSTKERRYFFTSEYCNGQKFFSAMAGKKYEEIEEVLVQILSALDYIHSAGIIHYDIKSQNILVDESVTPPQLKLVDFGLAESLQSGPRGRVGTLAYMAPEILGQHPRIDHRVDLYSLGMLLLKTLIMEWPFDIKNNEEIINWHLHDEVDARLFPSTVPRHLKEITLKLLKKIPSERFSHPRIVINFLNLATGKKYLEQEKAFSNKIPVEGPLVEREEILELVKKRFRTIFFSASREAVSSVVIIQGPPGIGKTRILEETRQFIELHEIPVHEITCRLQVPTWNQLEKLFQAEETSLPSLSEESEELTADWLTRRRTAQMMTAFRDRPCCLLIDDLHWADQETIDLIRDMHHRSTFERSEGRSVPLLILAATEQEEKEAIPISPLTSSGILHYLSLVLGETGHLSEIASLLQAYSGGLPLLVVEGLRYLTPKILGGEEELAPPPQIQMLYRDRLASLQEEERLLLLASSLIFRPATSRELASALDLSHDLIVPFIYSLGKKGLLSRHEGETYQIPQALALNLIQSADLQKKKNLHLKIASLLQKKEASQEVAYHWAKGGNNEEALRCYQVAAENLSQQGQIVSAIQCLKESLKIAPLSSDLWERLNLQKVRFLIISGLYPEATEALKKSSRPSPLRTELEAWLFFKQRNFNKAKELYQEALASTEDRFHQTRLKNALGNVALQAGEVEEAIHFFQEALSLEASLNPKEAVQITQNNLGLALSLKGEADEALSFFEKRLHRITGIGQAQEEIALRSGMGYLLLQTSRYQEATQVLQQALDLCERTGSLHALFSILGNLISALLKESRYAESLPYFRKLISTQEKLGSPRDLSYNLLREASLFLTLGMEEAAGETLLRGKHVAEELHEEGLLGWFHLFSGYRAKERGETDQERQCYEEALRQAKKNGNHSLIDWCHYALADLFCEMGQYQEASKEFAEIIAAKRDHEFELRVSLLKGKIQFATGILRNLEEELKLLEPQCLSFQELLVELYHLWGRIALASGQPERSLELFSRGITVVESIAATLPEEYQDRYRHQSSRKKLYEDFKKVQEGGTDMSEQTLKILLDINKRMVSEHDPNRLLEFIMDTAIQLSTAEEGLLLLLDESGQFEPRIARNIRKENLETIRFSRSIAREVVSSGQSLFSTNALSDARLKAMASVASLELKTVCCLPLKIVQKIFGVIYLSTSTQEGKLEKEHLPILETFADQASLALQNALLFQENQNYRQRLEEDLSQTKKNLEEKEEHLHELEALVSQSPRKTLYPYDQIIGRSKKMEEVLKILDKVTKAQVPVFIHGETGTGKELLARALHQNGPRRSKPFVAINCSAFTETILESELFGYYKGAFTGAEQDRKGLFEEADQGTLFLDEVADMSLTMQAKILRVIQEQELLRVGGRTPIKINVRIVSAANKDLKKIVREGKFREDLYYRIAGVSMTLPPLRERKEDIPLLMRYFVQKIKKENKISGPIRISRETSQRMMMYDWPGNIRELQQCLTNACLMAEGGIIQPEHLLMHKDLYENSNPLINPGEFFTFTPEKRFEDYEKEILIKTLQACRGNKSEAARKLGLSRLTLHKKLKQYGESFG